MRGRLIFPFIAELHRLDTQAMAPDYDEDFKEPVLVDTDDDGVGEPFRREHPPVRVPCQVEPEAFQALRMATSGKPFLATEPMVLDDDAKIVRSKKVREAAAALYWQKERDKWAK
jgi:hypothetical protein